MLSKSPSEDGRHALSCHLVIQTLFIQTLFVLALAVSSSVTLAQGSGLTLPAALAQTLAQNPGLKVFEPRFQGLDGRRITADQNPALIAGVEVENVLGSGNLQGGSGGEYTLALSSVFELGGKRDSRVSVIDSRFSVLEAERRAETLDVLAEVTQRFVATLALQEKLKLAEQAVALAEDTYDIVSRRASQGATPQAEVLRAKAALTRRRIEKSRLQAQYRSRKMALASLWGDTAPGFTKLEGNLFRAGGADSFEDLYRRVSESPATEVYASEERLREAEIQLARSQTESDIRWQVGIRRLEGISDTALTAGFSIPLFARQRNRGEVQAAMAARNEVEYRRADALLQLRSRLFDAYQMRQQSIETVEQIRNQMVPALTQALTQTREAYENGRYSYVEWTATQQDLLLAQQALVDAATAALFNQALIEQLTAQPLITVQGASAR